MNRLITLASIEDIPVQYRNSAINLLIEYHNLKRPSIDFILSEVKRLRHRYPQVMVAPLFYKVEDNLLYSIQESNARGGQQSDRDTLS